MNGKFALVRCAPRALVKQGGDSVLVAPVADVFETADAFVIKLDLPGATTDGISLTVESGTMEIRAAAVQHIPGKSSLLCSEIGPKTYYRAFRLGDGIDADRIDAAFADGVLTISLAKNESMKVRTITIR